MCSRKLNTIRLGCHTYHNRLTDSRSTWHYYNYYLPGITTITNCLALLQLLLTWHYYNYYLPGITTIIIYLVLLQLLLAWHYLPVVLHSSSLCSPLPMAVNTFLQCQNDVEIGTPQQLVDSYAWCERAEGERSRTRINIEVEEDSDQELLPDTGRTAGKVAPYPLYL